MCLEEWPYQLPHEFAFSTVAQRRDLLTKAEAARADEARRITNTLLNPSDSQMAESLKTGTFTNTNLTAHDFSNRNLVYGSQPERMMGAAVRLPGHREHNDQTFGVRQDQVLDIDIGFVDGNAFLFRSRTRVGISTCPT